MFPQVFSASLQELACSVLGWDLFLTPRHLGERWGLQKHFQLQYLQGNFCLFLPLYLFLPGKTMDLGLLDESRQGPRGKYKAIEKHFNSSFQPLEGSSNFQQCFICKGSCYSFLIIYGCTRHKQCQVLPFCMSLPLGSQELLLPRVWLLPLSWTVQCSQVSSTCCWTAKPVAWFLTSISEVVFELSKNGPPISSLLEI